VSLKTFLIKKWVILKKRRNGIFKIFLPLLIFLLLSGIFELTLRIFFPEPWSYYRVSEDFSWGLIPDVKTVGEVEGRLINININSKGLRDSEYSYEKPPGMHRILVIGDSTTEGTGVQKEEIYSEQLENMLSKNYEVITVGVKAFGTAQELAFLKKEGLKYNPDLIIIGFNTEVELTRNTVNNLYTLKDDKIIENKIKHSYLEKLLNRMKSFANSNIQSYIFLRRRMGILSNALIELGLAPKNPSAGIIQEEKHSFETEIFLNNPSEKTLQAWSLTKGLLKEIKTVSNENNIRLAVFAIHSQTQTDDFKFHSFVNENNFTLDEVDLMNPQKDLLKICQELDIPLIDPLEGFRNQTNTSILYLGTDKHWSAQGHKLASEQLYNGLKEKDLILS